MMLDLGIVLGKYVSIFQRYSAITENIELNLMSYVLSVSRPHRSAAFMNSIYECARQKGGGFQGHTDTRTVKLLVTSHSLKARRNFSYKQNLWNFFRR